MAPLSVDGGPRQQPASTYAGNAFEPSGCIFRTAHDREAHALREADRHRDAFPHERGSHKEPGKRRRRFSGEASKESRSRAVPTNC
jgi:hypothetical protein